MLVWQTILMPVYDILIMVSMTDNAHSCLLIHLLINPSLYLHILTMPVWQTMFITIYLSIHLLLFLNTFTSTYQSIYFYLSIHSYLLCQYSLNLSILSFSSSAWCIINTLRQQFLLILNIIPVQNSSMNIIRQNMVSITCVDGSSPLILAMVRACWS